VEPKRERDAYIRIFMQELGCSRGYAERMHKLVGVSIRRALEQGITVPVGRLGCITGRFIPPGKKRRIHFTNTKTKGEYLDAGRIRVCFRLEEKLGTKLFRRSPLRHVYRKE